MDPVHSKPCSIWNQFVSLLCYLVTLCTEIMLYRDYFYLDPVLSTPSFILPSVERIDVTSLFYTHFLQRYDIWLLRVPNFCCSKIFFRDKKNSNKKKKTIKIDKALMLRIRGLKSIYSFWYKKFCSKKLLKFKQFM